MTEGTGTPPSAETPQTGSASTAAPNTGTSPTQAPPAQPSAGEAQTGDEGDEEIRDPRALLRTFRELQEREKTQRNRLVQLEAARKRDEDAKLSDQERATKRLAELEATNSSLQQAIRERTVRYEVAVQAQRLGIVDPDAAYRLMDQSALEFGDDGSPTNVDTVLGAMLKARPYLQQQQAGPPAVPGTTNGASRARSPEGARIYRASELSDPAFFRANREDIGRAMNEGRVLADQ